MGPVGNERDELIPMPLMGLPPSDQSVFFEIYIIVLQLGGIFDKVMLMKSFINCYI